MLPPDATGKRGRAEAVLSAFSVPDAIAAQIKLLVDLDGEKVELSSTELFDAGMEAFALASPSLNLE